MPFIFLLPLLKNRHLAGRSPKEGGLLLDDTVDLVLTDWVVEAVSSVSCQLLVKINVVAMVFLKIIY